MPGIDYLEPEYRNFHALVKQSVLTELDRVLVMAGANLYRQQKYHLDFSNYALNAGFASAMPGMMLHIEKLLTAPESAREQVAHILPPEALHDLRAALLTPDGAMVEFPMIQIADVIITRPTLGVGKHITVQGEEATAWVKAIEIFTRHAAPDDFAAAVGHHHMYEMMRAFKETAQQRQAG